MSLPSDRPAGSAPEQAAEPVLLTSTDGGVRFITLHRPRSYNAFDLSLKAAFRPAVEDAAADPAVRAVVITGSGRAFCAGQDLKEHLRLVQAGDPRVGTAVRDFYNPVTTTIVEMRKPVIAAINGPAAGAGAGLALACDLRVAAESASFSMAFAGVALSADTGASFTLPRLVGEGRARAMMLLGERVDAAEALRIGLVDEVVPDGDLAGRVGELALRLAAGPTRAYGWIKASLQHAASADLASALDFEEQAQADLFAAEDHHEAVLAFTERRPPRFLGR